MRYMVREKLFRLGEDNDILNEAGQPVYQVDGKALSLHNLMTVKDLSGAELAQVTRKLMALMATYEIVFAAGGGAEVHQRFSSPLHPKWTISVQGGDELEMRGNLLGHDFTVSKDGQPIATVSKAWISLADAYGVDIADGQNDLLILCSVLALEAEQDRQRNN
jgi:uncharacterized protein YxjI